MKLSQEQIDKIYKILYGTGVSLLLGGFVLLLIIPKQPGWVVWTWLGTSFGILFIAGFVQRWATDEDKEEFKKAVKEAVQEAREDESKKKRKIPSDERVKSPLKGLTPQQEEVIIKLLCEKILVVNGHLKTSELKHLLKALSLDGNLDDHNLDRVIAWVEQETGEEVDARNLKYDYDAKISDKEVTKWGDMIRERFDLIEI